MSEPTDGGPAFPGGDGINSNTGPYGGMTLRDYFAAKAKPEEIEWYAPTTVDGCMTLLGVKEYDAASDYIKIVQTIKYRIADAMLAARNGGAA